MRTKITNCSYTDKNGYVWRKRFKNTTLSNMLKTRDHNEALNNVSVFTKIRPFLSPESKKGICQTIPRSDLPPANSTSLN